MLENHESRILVWVCLILGFVVFAVLFSIVWVMKGLG